MNASTNSFARLSAGFLQAIKHTHSSFEKMKALPDNRLGRPTTAIRTKKERDTGFYNQINSMNKT